MGWVRGSKFRVLTRGILVVEVGKPRGFFLMRKAIRLQVRRCAKRKPPGFMPVDGYLFQLEKRPNAPRENHPALRRWIVICNVLRGFL